VIVRAGLLLALLLVSGAQAREPGAVDQILDSVLPIEAAQAEPASEPAPVEAPAAPEAIAPEAPPVAPARPATLVEALAAAGLTPETRVEGAAVQVMQGQRALFHLGAEGQPVLDGVDMGKVEAAQPDGTAETYKGSGAGRLGVALDSSPARRRSYMKVWNGLAHPVAFELELAAIRSGQLMRRKIEACAVAAGAAHTESWPDPIIAVTVSKIAAAPAGATPCP